MDARPRLPASEARSVGGSLTYSPTISPTISSASPSSSQSGAPCTKDSSVSKSRVLGESSLPVRNSIASAAVIGANDTDDDERGVCMNCGAEMDYSPTYPWCPDCDERDIEEDD